MEESNVIRTIRENINPAYSLHDMNVISFEIKGNDMIMRTQSGMVKTTPVCIQTDGYVEFYDIRWDYSYVYLIDSTGNIGKFSGEKMFLKDFVSQMTSFGFSIMDETFGYNTTKFSGYLLSKRCHYECFIEIYHEGDMVFVSEETS